MGELETGSRLKDVKQRYVPSILRFPNSKNDLPTGTASTFAEATARQDGATRTLKA